MNLKIDGHPVLRAFGFLALALFVHGRAAAAQLAIAAAADLKFALDELAAEFRTNHPAVAVKISYGSSGNFYAQLRNRAPFDLYFSADMDYPRKLADGGHALDTHVFLYAVGRLVLWIPAHSPIDLEKQGMHALLAPSVKKVAIANPQHAPYGRAAVAALKSLNVYDRVEPRLVLGENVAQAAHFVQSAAADAGLIAFALAVAPPLRDTGRYWEIPPGTYPRMDQGGIVLNWTREPAAARAFRDFVLGRHGREVWQRYGLFQP